MVKVGKVLGLALVLTLGACGGGSGSSGGSSSGGGTTTGGGESQYAGPIGSTDVAQGDTRYHAVCASCHDNGAPAIANLGWTPEHMRHQVREGSANMPAIHEARLSAADLEAVLAYLQTIGGVAGGAAPAAAAPQ